MSALGTTEIMSKLRYLAGNIALFSISNFVSKILVFLLVPFYTNVLTTQEYGIADVFQVTLLLLVPALSINMGEAVLRFGIERVHDRGRLLFIGLKYVLYADSLVALLCAIPALFTRGDMRTYLLIFIIMFASNSLYEFLILYFQGCERVRIVVAGSILSTLVMILCNLYFLLVIKTGLYGYLLSQIIAYALACSVMLILFARNKGSDFAFVKDPELEKEMLSFGKPMIAYSTGAWINNASDRYIVSLLCGSAVNGVYGVAYKIPAILTVFQRIFAQSWQMSATKSYGDENSAEFFSIMYRAYHTFMVIGCAAIILLVRPIASFLFRKDFYEAWTFVPPLLISVVFGALTGFLGSINLAYKDSKAMGIATGIGALINVILNFTTVPFFGAMGAAVATAISYFLMYFMALMFTRKYVHITSNYVRDYIAYLLLCIQAVIQIKLPLSGVIKYALCALILLILILIHFKDVKEIVSKLFESIKGRRATVK